MRWILRWALVVVSVYALSALVLYVSQRSLMYHPNVNRPDIRKAPGFGVVSVTTADGLTLEGWYKPAPDPNTPTVIMFHGNAGNIEYRPNKMRPFIQVGYGVFLTEYRGFGGNPGEPTEQGLYKDARGYMDWIMPKLGVKPFLYGESLGSAVALQMAAEYDTAGVMLDGSFTSTLDVAQDRYPIFPFLKYIMHDQYNNVAKLPKVEEPLLIGMGQLDLVIPYRYGRALYEAYNGQKEIISYPMGNHFNLHDLGFDREIVRFVQDNTR